MTKSNCIEYDTARQIIAQRRAENRPNLGDFITQTFEERGYVDSNGEPIRLSAEQVARKNTANTIKMNREQLYRGQRTDGTWVFGSFVESKISWHGHKPHKSWIFESPISNGGWLCLSKKHAVKDSSVGEYTGLLDQNGNKIFEGDILRTAAGFGGVVTWHSNGYFFINTKTNTDSERSHAPLGEILKFASFTVIGNIHDNPDKLNEL